MNEEKLLEQIKQSANSCKIPEQLKPEEIENQLNKKVSWKVWNKRMYAIAGAAAAVLVIVLLAVTIPTRLPQTPDPLMGGVTRAENDQETSEEIALGAREIDTVYRQATDYEDVYQTLTAATAVDEDNLEMFAEDDMTTSDSGAKQELAAVEPMSGAGGNFSETNIQVEGVDEGDVVKTDGKYLYIIHENRRVRIVKINGAEMEEITVITMDEEQSQESIQEIYLTGDTLNIISQGYKNGLEQKDEDTYYMDYRPVTSVFTYDLADPKAPKLSGTVVQDGNYSTSRKTGNYIYLFTNFYNVDNGEMNPKDIVPLINNAMIEPTDIYLPVEPQGGSSMVISSINMDQPGAVVDQKVVMGITGQFYITTENIYIYSNNWTGSFDHTSIAKFHFEEGKVNGESAGMVRGTVTDTFAINEENGYLRVLTSSWSDEQVNYVYVLDEQMNIVGKIEGLAPGETIYSARFMGNTGYFVTYRQVDPLFSVDFSDPTNPQILGELKVTGFSEYLHFYGEQQLLGIGWETDPDTGARLGLKLSMFDISDPKNVKEIHKTVVENVDSFPGEYNYKALLVSPTKNIIGFVTTAYDSRGTGSSYMVFSYDKEKGFANEMAYTFAQSGYDYSNGENTRGVYVDDTFYVIKGSEILAFDINNNYKKSGELIK